MDDVIDSFITGILLVWKEVLEYGESKSPLSVNKIKARS